MNQSQTSGYSSQVGGTYTTTQYQVGGNTSTSQYLGTAGVPTTQTANLGAAGSYLTNVGGPTAGLGSTLSYSYAPQGVGRYDVSSQVPVSYSAGLGPSGGLSNSAYLTNIGQTGGTAGTYLTSASPTYPVASGSMTNSGYLGTAGANASTNVAGTYLSPTFNNSYGDFLGGLRTSVIQEIKGNIEDKGPQFSSQLREHLQSNVIGQETDKRQGAIVDTLKQYNLVSNDRLDDPQRIWQNINNPPVGLSQGNYTSTYTTSNLQPSATYTIREPVSTNVYSTYETSNVTLPKTPEKREYGGDISLTSHANAGETLKQSRQAQSVPVRNELRQSVLSPYRHTMYPEFALVEDLPDRRNLIDSINLFLQKSPAKESLLTSPARVSIVRQSLLSPAEIEVQSLLKEKYEDGSIYEGEHRSGVWHGKGRLTYPDGRILESEFKDGKGSGRGVIIYKNGKVSYEGNIVNNFPEGEGVLHSEAPIPLNGPFDHRSLGNVGNHWTRYEGEFRGGKRHGRGTLYLTNDEKYVGEFRDGNIEGSGTYHSRDGRTVQGTWQNGQYRQ